jgi:hypothetical protein
MEGGYELASACAGENATIGGGEHETGLVVVFSCLGVDQGRLKNFGNTIHVGIV